MPRLGAEYGATAVKMAPNRRKAWLNFPHCSVRDTTVKRF